MSRSNPTNDSPNPSTRWHEWKGGPGNVSYYDKEKKESIALPAGFTLLLLDHLSTVKGYNKKAKSGIYANEVRDTRSEPLIVKFFSGDTIAEGVWQEIKEKVAYVKGKFAASCYIAYRDGEELKIGNITFTGCALGPWFEFYKANKKKCDTQAIVIRAGDKDVSGDVEFIPPRFSIKEVSEETNEQAKKLDEELQAFFKGYFARPRSAQATPPTEREHEDEPPHEPEPPAEPPDDDEIPF